MAGDTTVVLVAAPDHDVVGGIRSLLIDDYRVRTTTDGEEALARLDGADVVLVDRDLQAEAGTVVATEIDRRAGSHSIAVMCSADREFESRRIAGDCLVKPVDETDLRGTVDRLARRARYEELMAECATLAARRGALEAHTRDDPDDEEYAAVQRRLGELFDELDELVAAFDGEDFRAAFTACDYATDSGAQRVQRFS
ncbi:HalX domain-containing protein [Natrinema sp. 1APR25-10V2]|uniref:HalX domain-containing protein n=1 Tax=Natrinema sp. 1APR25-10V2 TaxID=2951081 RepID=UPI002876DDC2|nr:HalX domain-containing protein [Natrinema sp. 1APR25-10V2]MDS0477413.1 HalX domain-containing protein [Natrinema sp. 1APR25-10V2]